MCGFYKTECHLLHYICNHGDFYQLRGNSAFLYKQNSIVYLIQFFENLKISDTFIIAFWFLKTNN